MDTMMDIEEVRAAYHQEPFRRFALKLRDGRTVKVHRREWMMIAPSGCSLVVIQADDHFDMLETAAIAELKVEDLTTGYGFSAGS